MQISSSQIALKLLSRRGSLPAAPPRTASDLPGAHGTGHITDPRVTALPRDEEARKAASEIAYWEAVRKENEPATRISDDVRFGRRGLFDPEALKISGSYQAYRTGADPRLAEVPGMKFEGDYAPGYAGRIGEIAPKGETQLTVRSDIMALGYHYGKMLAEAAQRAVHHSRVLEDHADTMIGPGGRVYGISAQGYMLESLGDVVAASEHETHEIVRNYSTMHAAGTSLAAMFGFDSTSVTLPAMDGNFDGFSISHSKHGKIMDVAEDGTLTLYGHDGKAYSARDYNQRDIDGGIPELFNDERRRQLNEKRSEASA